MDTNVWAGLRWLDTQYFFVICHHTISFSPHACEADEATAGLNSLLRTLSITGAFEVLLSISIFLHVIWCIVVGFYLFAQN